MSVCKGCMHKYVCFILENHGEPQKCDYYKDISKHIDLPCKIGDKIFYFSSAGNIYCEKVEQFVLNSVGILVDAGIMFNSRMIGERFFLSREDAEKALKEREKV